MQFDLITIFPDIFNSYINESILKRAQKKKIISIKIHNLRDFTTDKHKTVDDRPYGGGPGMVMKIEPLYRCLKSIKRKKHSKAFLMAAKGKMFTQLVAKSYTKLDQIILICGHYEGVDERIKKFIDGEMSTGQYVLTGGELPAMTIVDAISRLLPGVLGHTDSPKDETFSKGLQYREYPHYTRPEKFQDQKVPKTLLSGDHKAISAWRRKNAKGKRLTG
jgi:tRNA (guanine37-N1)-methyltransferase